MNHILLLYKTSEYISSLYNMRSVSCNSYPSKLARDSLLILLSIFLLSSMKAYSISRLTTVPSLMREVLSALQTDVKMRISSTLKLLVLSGEVFSISLWDMITKSFPGISILNLYGSTEVSK